MHLYRIRNWEKHYENNRTRDLKYASWVPIPNNHDSDGYTTLITRKNGPALFGAWIAMIQVASKCDPRGTLLRRGGSPHDPESLSRITRIPESIFAEMLSVTSDECNWLIKEDLQSSIKIPQEGAAIPHLARAREYGTERNGTERNGSTTHAGAGGGATSEFEQFWETYPKKVGKRKALEVFNRLKGKPPIGQVLEAVRSQVRSDQWKKEGGRYIPHPTTWLTQGRWDDVLPPAHGPEHNQIPQPELRAPILDL